MTGLVPIISNRNAGLHDEITGTSPVLTLQQE
jgi:hypothetical protein